MIEKMSIWLADLTYTQQSLASDVVPAAIGGLAEIAETLLGVEAKIYKIPDDLLRDLSLTQPDVLGFSNYVWNSNLSLTIARIVRQKFPEVIIVMGGPNVPSEAIELESFLRTNSQIDFAVLKEGELGLLNLLTMIRSGFTRQTPVGSFESSFDGFSFINSNNVLVHGNLVRFMNLEELPSPYLSGRLDEFLDGRFMPVIQTNRGCPFTCTFCTEGQHYWSKVRRKPTKLLQDEIEYIAEFMTGEQARKDLLIADSNFGMYDPDQEVARTIAGVQASHGWPSYINVATGKNRKEKVIETARLVNGAMNLAGSVQSLDILVLENIKRDNISPDALLEMAFTAASIGTNTYSEVILALPGETMPSHLNTLKKLVDAGFTMIAMYQMMLLPATEMNSVETREKYDFETRFRLLPRCYGTFSFMGESFTSAEIEEIVVSHNAMSLSDYLDCRVMHFFITVFYNDGVFLEFHRLLSQIGGSSFDWIESIHNSYRGSNVESFVNEFVSDTVNELWIDRSALEVEARSVDFVERAISGEIGRNVLYFHKGRSLTRYLNETLTLAESSFLEYLHQRELLTDQLILLIKDMFVYRKAQLEDIFLCKPSTVAKLYSNLDVEEIMDKLFRGIKFPLEFPPLIDGYSKTIELHMDASKLLEMRNFEALFGTTDAGISRTLSRVYLRNFFRSSSPNETPEAKSAIEPGQFGFRAN